MFSSYDVFEEDDCCEEKAEKIDSTVTKKAEKIATKAENKAKYEKTLFEKYNDVKQKYPDNIVLYRVGDFFEVLGEDAKAVAEWTDTTLTGRNDPNAGRVDMVGFQFHMLDRFVEKIRTHQGVTLVQDENGQKMSKSKGNVVDPNDVVEVFGADVLRTYVLFMGDYEKAAPWSENSVKGCKRFIDKVWNLSEILVDGDEYSKELSSSFHKTIKKVSEDIETLKYNTAIAALMTLLNAIYAKGEINRAELKAFLLILNPFAPHVTEEMWEQCGFGSMLAADGSWPTYDEAKCKDSEIEIVVQICGKIKAKLMIAADATEDEVLATAKADEKVSAELNGKQIIKEIYVPGKLVNIVAK